MIKVSCVGLLMFMMLGTGLTDFGHARVVTTTQGPVKGYKAPGENVFVFYGIPYATAPKGANRFKAPLSPPEWTEPFDAINKDIICPQMSYFPILLKKQEEDCLVANIYVPDTKENALPVVVYVHGGAFQMLYGDFTTPKRLIREQNLVVVNFNYRLGPHGFLCLGTQDIPGNAGMKDQIALLRWVKKNIANFNGNPDDVTVIGYSAGSAAVELLLLSPLAKELFHKVILESGSGLAPFSVQTNPIENAWVYAKMLNYTSSGNNNDTYELEEFYKSTPYDILHSINVMDRTDASFIFSPCVERDVGEELFLREAPINIIKEGKHQKLPILYGFTEMEGLLQISHFDTWKYKMNEKFSDFLPSDLKFNDQNEKERVALQIKKYYFGQRNVDEETIFRYIDYFTDVIFAYSTLRSIRLHVNSGNNNIYLYRYSFVHSGTPFVPHTQIRGANHCSQTFTVVDGNFTNLDENTFPTEFIEMKKTMRALWINFILKGKPVPDGSDFPMWPPVDANGGPHMLLDNTIKLQGPLLQQRVLFWDDIYDRYYSTPLPPPGPLPQN